MTTLSLRPFVATVTAFVAVVYLACAALFLAVPDAARGLFGLWFHGIDLQAIAREAGLTEVAAGFVTSLIATAILAALFAVLWNRFHSKEVTR
ncbi:MAG: hypothetical protein HY369_04015 [Candidatus Aenigmarchaeota archaeon]|nr:hypothetical protein [Candidatus Aenigmarchaeota archaeon]